MIVARYLDSGGKFVIFRKPNPARNRPPSKKKCKSNCNCANCKQEKESQEYEKRYRDASMERRQRKSPRKSPKKSPRKSPRKSH